METLTITQITTTELKAAIREELEEFFRNHRLASSSLANSDEIGGIELAIQITGLSKPTIYSLTSERKIPHSKQGKRLYFSRKQLVDWVRAGERPLASEIASRAQNYTISRNKKD